MGVLIMLVLLQEGIETQLGDRTGTVVRSVLIAVLAWVWFAEGEGELGGPLPSSR
jgi:hypothetical protein